MSTPRSYLYVPGNAPDRLAKALDRGADALIVDLEDAVPPGGKEQARTDVAAWVRDTAPTARSEIWVRVNPGERGLADAAAVVAPGLRGVVAAKAGSSEDLRALDAVLHHAESSTGCEPGAVAVVPLVETAPAVLDLAGLAHGPRVRRLQLGEADLAADLGISPGPDQLELLYVRSSLVLVSAACGLDPPVAPVSTDFRDLDRLRRSTEALARLGFVGRACIHPAQVAVVNEVFIPDPAELDRARRLIADFEVAVAAGSGVLLDDRGRMVDEAVVRQARRLVALAR